MQTIVYIGLAFFLGVLMSIYFPMNSTVAKYLGSPITANMTFFLTAAIAAVLIFLFSGQFETLKNLGKAPLWLYTTGIISAFMILGTTFLIPLLGARKFFILLIAGQILMAIVVSHFGILESPKDPVSIKKLTGAFFVIIGAVVSID